MTKMTVLLIHQDNVVGRSFRDTLKADGYIVFGPLDTLSEAYMSILNDNPDMAIIDKQVCQDQTEIISDALIQIGIEHLIIFRNPPHVLKRELGHGPMRGVVLAPHKNTADGLSHELCHLRAEKIRREAQSPNGLNPTHYGP